MKTHHVPVVGGTTLFVRESGEGRPIVFVPGWTFAHDAFDAQVPALSDDFRVVTYDPRGTGRSPATLMGNTYAQHGDDLAALIETLDLHDVVLVAWSYGSNAAYAYLRAHGHDRIGAVAILDESPKPMRDAEGDWGEGTATELGAYVGMLRDGHAEFMSGYAPTMLSREVPGDELNRILASSQSTQPHVAWALFADGALADWREEARAISKARPYLNVVRADQETAARTWLSGNAPEGDVSVYPSHMMFWEFPDRFNEELRSFAKTGQGA
ncbi:MAG: alpha/beta hydrolase [Litorimonas sp.]